ncbi:response regulator [Hydrogenophaga palleronii]|uniref:response regulator n=1 Tax=Hydrogenophaga palleronii TaxID=65655 RepID=UPI000825CB39|nr:response regulator [Hydrogenophaga palleronii]
MNRYERFILVDDSEADNVFHEIMIRRSGFTGELRVFESGADALAFLQADPLTLRTCLFLDINMPQMNGFEFARLAAPLLRHRPQVVVMMLTSSDAASDKALAAEQPLIRGFLTKPLTVDLVRELQQAG